jgi:hypothetical protein
MTDDKFSIQAQRFGCGSPIPEKCAFLEKFSEPPFQMTNDKFSMTNFQFRLSALVAAVLFLRSAHFWQNFPNHLSR